MERYSGTQATEAFPVDLVAEWAAPGGETGLEEPMWQLGLGTGPESYPGRPDEPDCIYYLRTGFCGYGNRCRFNHPRDRSTAKVREVLRASGAEHPERAGQPVCQYYMRTGMCKFGASCKYHHPKNGTGSSALVTLNIYGYPLRQGEQECLYYSKTGRCKFGVSCKFHHPQPAGVQTMGSGHSVVPTPAVYPSGPSPSAQPSQQYGMIQGNWSVMRPAMLPGSYVPGSYGPMLLPPGVVPVPGWSPYPSPVSPVASPSTQPTVGPRPIYGIPQLSPSATSYTGPYVSINPLSSSPKEGVFPERPGLPECQYFLRTGDCKFGAACKYHHPPEWSAQKTNFVLSPMGLPLRPGMPLCSHYAQNGVCTFGPSCRFDHPMRSLSYSSSTSSLIDIPIAPYPVGLTNATLAPSSSSTDLRPDLLPGLGKDAISAQMSSMNSDSTSVGSIYSSSGPGPRSSIQQYTSGQGTLPSSGGSVKSRGGEVHTSS